MHLAWRLGRCPWLSHEEGGFGHNILGDLNFIPLTYTMALSQLASNQPPLWHAKKNQK